MNIIIDRTGHFVGELEIEFNDIDSSLATDKLDDLLGSVGIRIAFDGFSDGRFLTIARRLKLLGYKGHIRVAGEIVPDQFPMALRVGVDSVEISEALARRCTQEQWVAMGQRIQGNYQSRLSG
ncbi:DUF934 domain-containing protein [Luminiphilus sp.]|nr:DUF934 domain-containing protein [Luminiphilus sp.]